MEWVGASDDTSRQNDFHHLSEFKSDDTAWGKQVLSITGTIENLEQNRDSRRGERSAIDAEKACILLKKSENALRAMLRN